VTRATPLGRPRRARGAFVAFAVVATVLMPGLLNAPAHAGLPLTYDHIAGLPRHVTPESVGVDADGNVYVADTNTLGNSTDDRLVQYDADGTFLDVIAGPGTAAGSLDNPTSVAIGPDGHFYMTENGAAGGGIDRVSVFDGGGTYVSSWGTTGGGNGSFNAPQGIAVDSTGTVYVADTTNGRIQRFSSSGTWLNPSWSMSGYSLANPKEVAVDASDRVWVVDGSKVARFSSAGVLQASWSSAGSSGIAIDDDGNVWVSSTSSDVVRAYDASGTLLQSIGGGELTDPQGVATHGNSVYVADTGNGRVVRYMMSSGPSSWSVPGAAGLNVTGSTVYAADGADLLTFDTSGTAGTSWASANAAGTVVDGSGNVWVSSTADNEIRQYDAAGNLLQTILASNGLTGPKGLALGGGYLYAADPGSGKIFKYNETTGAYVASWGLTGATGVAISGSTVYGVGNGQVRMFSTSGLAAGFWNSSNATDLMVDGSSNVWVSSSDGVVREYDASHTLAATIGGGLLDTPVGVSLAGNHLYVADTGLGEIVKFSFTGMTAAWGEYPGAGVEDAPIGVASDASNNVYVTNKSQDKIQVFAPDGSFVREFGGTGAGNGKMNNPAAVAIGPTGDVFVADSQNNRIEVFQPDGTYLTQWGSAGYNASLNQMNQPAGIAVDADGNVWVADTFNNRLIEFDSNGNYVTTIGTVNCGSSACPFGTGDGQFREPRGVAIDADGNVWVADSKNNRVQAFTPGGTLVAKWGGSGTGGVSSGTADGKLKTPYDVDIDAEGSVWVADYGNDRIQRLTTTGTFLSKLGSSGLDTYQFSGPAGIGVDPAGAISVSDSLNNRVQVFIDNIGPDTTIVTGPGTSTGSSTAQFTFTANEPGATFECKIDAGGWASCASGDTWSGFAEGPHEMDIRATDSTGHLGNPQIYTWSVDLTPPTVSIDSGPSSPTSSTTANFAYTSSEPVNASFVCQLDGVDVACGSSYTATGLSSASHTFSVWARDGAGNQSISSADYTWTVDTDPPTVTIDSGPSGTSVSSSAKFFFSSADVSDTFECHLDGDSSNYAPCSSPMNYTGLQEGTHKFYVRAFDALGNMSTEKVRQWSVDLAVHRPDGWVGVGSRFVGNNIYNDTAQNQAKTIKTKAHTTVSFIVRAENDGSDTDTYTIQGDGSAKGYTVTYLLGITDITTKVVNGTYSVNVSAGSYRGITVKVAVTGKGLSSWSSLVTTTSGHDPSKSDTVKAIVKRV
jgi:sugar lactone lactonase YvrE